MDDYTRTTYISRVVWVCLFMIAIGYEFFTLPRGHRDTLSDFLWDSVRFTPWKFAFFPFWSWLTWHWWLRPEKTLDYRDGIAIFIGILWAVADYFFLRKP